MFADKSINYLDDRTYFAGLALSKLLDSYSTQDYFLLFSVTKIYLIIFVNWVFFVFNEHI